MQTNGIDSDRAAVLIVGGVRDVLIIEAREKSWEKLRAVVALPRVLGAVVQLAIANQKIVRLPSRWLCGLALSLLWNLKVSTIPPQALPYMIGSYIMNTSKLKTFLGTHYEEVIQFTIEQALKDCFVEEHRSAPTLARV